MRNIIKISIISMFFYTANNAETIYQVEPQSENNRIVLTIDNASRSADAGTVEINLTRCSEFLSFGNNKVECENIKAGESSTAEFTFKVLRNAPVNKKDTLEFAVIDNNGSVWEKQIIIEFLPPKEFKLEQNFPNPFNPLTTIRYQIPKTEKVTLEIYNTLGQRVVTLVNKEQEAGYYDVHFNASRLASGLYVYRIKAGKHHAVKKMMVLK